MKDEIKPVYRGAFANEYGDYIMDYSKEKSPLTNRLIKPYVTSETHGQNVFDELIEFINKLDVLSVLDLGCGAGELLSKLSQPIKYGTTIHVGEVEYAKSVYGLQFVLPLDMRNIDTYFSPKSFELVIAHCSLHFISPEERTDLVNNKIHKILGAGGHLIIVNYKGNKETDVENIVGYEDITNNFTKINTMGDMRCFTKIG